MSRAPGRLLWLLAALLLCGCTKPRTEVVVVVTTDGVRIPDDVDQIQLRVADTTDLANPTFEKSFRLCGAGTSGDCLGLPLDFTLIPGAKHPEHSTRVQLTARRGGSPVIDDAAIFTFAPEQSLRLDFVLYANCLGNVDCAARDQACGRDDHCQPIMPTPIHGEPDLATPPPADLAVGRDLAVGADLALGPDLTPPHDLAGCVPMCGTTYHCGPDPANCFSDPNYCGTCAPGNNCMPGIGSAMCVACGGTSQPCCMTNPSCSGTYAYCQGATGTCQPCGSASGQVCCPGMVCDPGRGLTCSGSSCVLISGWTRTTFAPGVLNAVWSNGTTTIAVGAGPPRIYRKVSPATTFAIDNDPDANDLYGVWGKGNGQVAAGDGATILNYTGSWTRVADASTGIMPTTVRQNGVFVGPSGYWVAGGNVGTAGSESFDYLKNGTGATNGTGYARTSVWSDGALFVIMASSDAASYVSTDGGLAWQTIVAASPTAARLRKAWGTDATHVWLVGDGGYVYKYTGGSTMTLDTQLTANLKGVSGSSTTDIWAVGDSGSVYHFNGTAWSAVASPSLLASDSYKDISVVSASELYVVGTTGSSQLILRGP